MPIARAVYPPDVGGRVILRTAHAAEIIPAWSAVALVEEGGTRRYYLCGARQDDYCIDFIGFARNGMAVGQSAMIVTGSGSPITPIVEGGANLVPDWQVFLALTPGQVTQTPPEESGSRVLPVGYAISTSVFILMTEIFVRNP